MYGPRRAQSLRGPGGGLITRENGLGQNGGVEPHPGGWMIYSIKKSDLFGYKIRYYVLSIIVMLSVSLFLLFFCGLAFCGPTEEKKEKGREETG